MDFDLRLLRCALALAEQRNFARAARAVHLSQPALSRAIQELEQRAGTRLFDRTPVGVEPTDSGIIFLEHARELMSRASDLRREMNLLKGLDKGELRIGAGTYPSSMFVNRALAKLVAQHPTVTLSVVNDNWSALLPLLRRRDLDLAVIDVTAAEKEPEIKVIKLQQHQGYMVFRADHPLASLNKMAGPMDRSYPFVTTSRFPTEMFKGLIETLWGSGQDKVVGPKALVGVACESLHMMKDIALGSDAIAILPLNIVAAEIERGALLAIPAPAWVRGNFGIAYLQQRSLSPLAETFVRLVQEADAELLAWEEKTAKSLFRKPARAKAAHA